MNPHQTAIASVLAARQAVAAVVVRDPEERSGDERRDEGARTGSRESGPRETHDGTLSGGVERPR